MLFDWAVKFKHLLDLQWVYSDQTSTQIQLLAIVIQVKRQTISFNALLRLIRVTYFMNEVENVKYCIDE